jgi:hypothetical protein
LRAINVYRPAGDDRRNRTENHQLHDRPRRSPHTNRERIPNVSTARATILGKPIARYGGWRGDVMGRTYVQVKEVKMMKIVIRTVESVKSTQWPDS